VRRKSNTCFRSLAPRLKVIVERCGWNMKVSSGRSSNGGAAAFPMGCRPITATAPPARCSAKPSGLNGSKPICPARLMRRTCWISRRAAAHGQYSGRGDAAVDRTHTARWHERSSLRFGLTRIRSVQNRVAAPMSVPAPPVRSPH